MSAYDERPWLALLRRPAGRLSTLEYDNALEMFRAGVARDPDRGRASSYFDGTHHPARARRAQRRARQRAAGRTASPPATGWRSTCRTCRSSSSPWWRPGRPAAIDGVDQPDEPGAGARPTCSRTPARRCWSRSRRSTTRSARDVVPGHRRAAGAHHQRAGLPDPATTSGCSPGITRQRHEGTTDLARAHRAAPRRGAAAGRARAGRRRVPDLHLGHDRGRPRAR